MLIAALVALAVLTVPLSHGRWSALAAFRPQAVWLIWLALAVQVVQFSVTDLGPMDPVVHVGTYVLAAAFVVVNRDIPGLWLIALGGLSNGVTIALNGGSLPARAAALREAGWTVDTKDFVNSGVKAHAHLAWLGDMFAWPAPLPLHNVFSVGDVLLVVGAFWAVHGLARRPPAVLAAEPTDGRGRHRILPAQRSQSALLADAPDSMRVVAPATT